MTNTSPLPLSQVIARASLPTRMLVTTVLVVSLITVTLPERKFATKISPFALSYA